jgi:hypothetical protein
MTRLLSETHVIALMLCIVCYYVTYSNLIKTHIIFIYIIIIIIIIIIIR